ncbi:MAG TPA: phosphoribosylglycinamide formyltransferase [Tepidimicrobium sp.]|nr:phosphoribosylglycinamide formyltransferase [Tepidimicrobium sp.]
MSSVNIGVLISGGGTNLQSIINNVGAGNIDGKIRVVISNRKDAYGLIRARNAGIETLYIDEDGYDTAKEFNKRILQELSKRDVELVVLAGYMKVLPKEFVEEYAGRIINVHPSLIPSFCGRGCYGDRVHKMALDYGVKITGVTVHFVDEGTDTGPIILQRAVEVMDDDTVDTLKDRVLKVEHELLPEAIRLYCQGRLTIKGRKVIID